MALVSSIALSVALVKIASDSASYAADLADFAARHAIPSSEPLDLAVGAWLAHGWIEQDTTSNIEELTDGDPERFDLAGGDFEAIRAIFAAVSCSGEEEAEEEANQFQDAVEDAARAAWEAHYTAMHAAHRLGAEHGAEHAEAWVQEWRREPTNPNDPEREPTEDEVRADYDRAIKTLATMSTASDWSTSAAEAWSLTGRAETSADDEPAHIQEAIRYWYVAGYETGAMNRSEELASDLMGERMCNE